MSEKDAETTWRDMARIDDWHVNLAVSWFAHMGVTPGSNIANTGRWGDGILYSFQGAVGLAEYMPDEFNGDGEGDVAMGIMGFVRKDKYDGQDGTEAVKIVERLMGADRVGAMSPNHFTVDLWERGLITERQWRLPWSCALLEAIEDHPEEWEKSKWHKIAVLNRLTN